MSDVFDSIYIGLCVYMCMCILVCAWKREKKRFLCEEEVQSANTLYLDDIFSM